MRIVQVNLVRACPPHVLRSETDRGQIQRHGARFPTSGAAARIKAALSKLRAATDLTDPLLEFVQKYKYDLGQDDLVPFGATQ